MKIKFLSILAAATLLVACGPSEEDAKKVEDELNNLMENLDSEMDKAMEDASNELEDANEAVDSMTTEATDAMEDATEEIEAATEETVH